jgi:DNA repair protein RadC
LATRGAAIGSTCPEGQARGLAGVSRGLATCGDLRGQAGETAWAGAGTRLEISAGMRHETEYQFEYGRHERGRLPVGFQAELDASMDEPALTIHAPAIERPRERMVAFGPAALSNVELVALLIGGGKSEQRALAMLQRHGGIGGLTRCLPHELLATVGVGEAAATAVCAAIELARRIGQLEMPFETAIRGPEDVRRFVRSHLRGRSQEVLMVLGLDSRQRVRLVREVAQGSLDSVEIHPREVFRPLVRAGSHAVILVHNHPSGEAGPSPSDQQLTRRMSHTGELLGIPVLDHLIVTETACVSLVGLGLLPPPTGVFPEE